MKKTFIILMAAAAMLAGCRNSSTSEGHDHEGEEAEEHEHEHEGEEGHSHSGEIAITEERQKTLGITVDTVSLAPFSEVIHTSGEIISATGDETTVVARSSGIVNLGSLTEGAAVGRGSRIASISSKNLGTGDQLTKARIAFETAKKEYDRDQQLRADNIVSESHLDQSKLAYEQAKAELDALGGENSSGAVVVTSPLGGFVKKLCVSQGDYVETGAPIAVVSQNRRLQLRADVSEKYYNLISQVKDANFKTSYGNQTYSLKDLGGRLVSYGRASDGDFYVPVTFEFDNKGDIVAGSYVEVYLKTATSQNAVSVPVEAVVEDQGVHYVFVQHEPDAFLKREVTIGQSDGERILIKSGLNEGEAVVVTGAVQVKLASVTSVPAGHTHNH